MPNWFKLEANSESLELVIYDYIGEDYWGESVSGKSVLQALNNFTGSRINVRINSLGGSVFDAIAIMTALARHPAHVTAYIDGVAASAASIVAMAADTVEMVEGGWIMIHEARAGVGGTAAEHRAAADLLEKMNGQAAIWYSRRMEGYTLEQIAELMFMETWFDSEHALEAGLADTVFAPVKMELSTSRPLDTFSFRFTPPKVKELLSMSRPTQEITEYTPPQDTDQEPEAQEPEAQEPEAQEPEAQEPNAREQLKTYMARFGSDGANWFAEGLTLEACKDRLIAKQASELETLRAKVDHATQSEQTPLSQPSADGNQNTTRGLAGRIRISAAK